MALKGDIFEAKTLDELKTMGKLADVRGPLKEMAAKYNVKVLTNAWDKAWAGIQAVKKAIEEGAWDDPFFKNKAARYIFILTQVDGENRMNLLGVNMKHYKDAKFARQWMTEIANSIHPDNCKHPMAAEALNNLTELYRVMTGR